jgi:hypothetical protein
MNADAAALSSVEAKLTQLQRQLDSMSARREDPYVMLGWVREGISSVIAGIEGAS